MSDTEDTGVCYICEEEYEPEDLNYVQSVDDVVCDNCLDECFFECDECGEHFHENVACTIPYGNYTNDTYCEHCFDSVSAQCEVCGDTYHADDITSYDFYDGSTRDVCPDCDGEIYTCDHCGMSVWADDVTSDQYGDCYCPDCYPGDNENTSIYYDNHEFGTPPQRGERWSDYYSWAPGEPETNILYGVELEVDVNTNGAPNINPTEVSDSIGRLFFPEVYQVSDSSLTDYGIECISNPCSLEYHKTTHPWKEILKILRDSGYYSHDSTRSCGIHVHISRERLSQRELEIIVFIYEWFSDKMAVISRRNPHMLSQFSGCLIDSHFGGHTAFKRGIVDQNHTISSLYHKSDSMYSKMWMCNTKPGATLEIRLFNGSTRFDRLIESITFVDMTVQFAKKLAAAELPVDITVETKNQYKNDLKLITLEWRDLLDFARTEYPDQTPIQYIHERFGDMMGLNPNDEDEINFIMEYFGL